MYDTGLNRILAKALLFKASKRWIPKQDLLGLHATYELSVHSYYASLLRFVFLHLYFYVRTFNFATLTLACAYGAWNQLALHNDEHLHVFHEQLGIVASHVVTNRLPHVSWGYRRLRWR
ncbi:hypothetical protein GQ600_27582 [Phytophthora cactorum]|nr:hypothetical protein GQ600_27582 [Phytophthora cactorum]